MSQDNDHQPSGPEPSQDRKTEVGKKGEGSPGEAGIGTLLRNQREQKGIDYARIYEITRLRPSILEALENEAWDRLPSPVFVMGFIRSYARALGLDEKEVVELYLEAFPIESRQPKPRVESTGSGKGIAVFLIIILFIIVSAYFIWKGHPAHEKVGVSSDTSELSGDTPLKSKDIGKAPDETEPRLLNQENRTLQPPSAEPEIMDMEVPDDSLEEEREIPSSSEAISSDESEPNPQHEISELILKAYVREGTWVRIFVDDQDPREYIFRPGSQPEWRARDGFELLVGNAGGIELEFNGEKIKDLGAPGQVVRLKLPKNYKRSASQD
jgi:cytoskeleton protein RodZ